MYGLKKDTIEKILNVFTKYSQIHNVVLFGSRAIGTYKNGSDIDLCLKGDVNTKFHEGNVAITSDGKRMYFGTFIDRDGAFIDTVHFPPVAEKYRFRGKGIYKITGKVVEEFDCISIEVTKMIRYPIIEDPRYSDKRLQANSVKNFNRRVPISNRA